MVLYYPLATFAVTLTVFHCSEFALAWRFQRHSLGWSSWLFSRPYAIAMSLAVVEHAAEAWLAPHIKQQSWVTSMGILVVILGELMRKVGMVTAEHNFTHEIRRQKDSSHVLVTSGIYRYIRHPGYLGWYIWCLGTQLMLVNPVCLAVFAYVAWRFFRNRIQYEEEYLRRFFGQQYVVYAEKTPTWLPWIP